MAAEHETQRSHVLALRRRRGVAARLLAACFWAASAWSVGPPESAAAQSASAYRASFEERRDAALTDIATRPLAACSSSDDRDGGRCLWRQIASALALLHLSLGPEAAGRADRLLRDAAMRLPAAPGWKRLVDPPRPGESRRTDAAWDFPFLTAALLDRAVGLFGAAAQPQAAHRLTQDTEWAIGDLFWAWASDECRLADADPSMVWRPWGSENHDVQRVYTCWAGAELLLRRANGRGRAYKDGSTVVQQQAAWTAYLKAFIRSRATAGVQVEYFSPTYAKYFLSVFYNLLDFASDAELRRLSESFVTLWWALWAQEQIAGAHGGSKVRAYNGREAEGGTPVDGLPWVYFGVGPQAAEMTHPGHLPMLLSRFRPPAVVSELARGGGGRGPYEVWTRQLGLAAGPIQGERYALSPDLGAVARYAFVAPGYVMGASIVPRLPAQRWTAISSQNRWNGVVLADGPDARVFAAPEPQGGRSTYNAVLAAQSRGTQIVQRLPPPFSRGAGDMLIHIGPRLRRVERDGWIFVEGSAFVAARPAFGGYSAEADRSNFRLLDQRSPVVIQTATRADYESFEAFQAAVLTAPLQADAGEVSFQGLGGAGRLRFFRDSDRRPEVNGLPIGAPAGWVLYSPFVRQEIGSSIVEIGTGSRTLELRFD